MLPIKKHVAWLKGVWSDEKSLEDLRSNAAIYATQNCDHLIKFAAEVALLKRT